MGCEERWHSAPVPKVYFDERIAQRYDADSEDMFEPAVVEPAVDLLADLAGAGDALELGIGTGRIALPLSRRGVRVHGIDLSPAMVSRLRAKPGADAVGMTIGDFATTRVGGTFRVAYLVYTITNLTTQDEQVECFRNVAAHLKPGGCLVIEVFVPSSSGFLRGRPFGPSTGARAGSASTSTTSPPRSSTHTTTGSRTAGTRSFPRPIATFGRPSSI